MASRLYEYITIFDFHTCSREIIDTFSHLEKNTPFFLVHLKFKLKARSLKTLHDYNLAHGLRFYCRFDELDFVSILQMCQKYKVQIVLCTF